LAGVGAGVALASSARALVSAFCAAETSCCAFCVAVWSSSTVRRAARQAAESAPDGAVGVALGVGAVDGVADGVVDGVGAVNPSAPDQPSFPSHAAVAFARSPSAVDSAASARSCASCTARWAAGTDRPVPGTRAAVKNATAVSPAVPVPFSSCSSVSFACASDDCARFSADVSAVGSSVARVAFAATASPTATGTESTVPAIGNATVADDAGPTVPVAVSVAFTDRCPATAVR
jgi:hypothetical protein